MTSNIVSLPFKQTQKLPTFAEALVQHVTDTFNTTHPDAIRHDAEGLAEQRDKIFRDGELKEVHEKALTSLVAYYAQLTYVITKLPLDISLSFPWYPVFAANASSLSLGGFPAPAPISVPDLQYERLSVLYNIAAMHSAIGAQQRRTDAEGLKACIAAFQNAAGTLSHMLTLLPLLQPEPPALNPPSPDLSVKAIEALRDICLAQAQEVFWQKAVMDRLKNGTIAKLAAKVSEYYGEAATEATAAKGAGEVWPTFSFPQPLLNHLTLKHLHFGAVAQFRKSADDLSANRYGDELGRLAVAESLVKKALDGPKKGVNETVIRDLKGLQATLADNSARATKDNRLIYLEAVTPQSSLGPIVPASMVKATPAPDVVNPLAALHNGPKGLGKPYFESLVPYEVTLSVQIYNDRCETLLKDELVDRSAELDKEASQTLDTMNLPGSIQAILQPVGLPPSLISKAEEVRASGGAERLRTMLYDVRKVSKVNRKVLTETYDVLEQEEVEDTQHRSQYGTDRWRRTPSHEASSHLRARADNFANILESAGSSDQLVRAKFGEWEMWIEALDADEATLCASIPALATPSIVSSNTSSQTSALTRLRRSLDTLDDLRTSRTSLIDSFKLLLSHDDIREAASKEAENLSRTNPSGAGLEVAQFEELIERELGKYKKFKVALGENAARQEDALEEVKLANADFVDARKADPALKKREESLQKLDMAYHKQRELATNLAEGLTFYGDLAKLLSELRDACKQWVYARQMEGRDQVNALAHALDGVRITPGTYDPMKDGPIRFG